MISSRFSNSRKPIPKPTGIDRLSQPAVFGPGKWDDIHTYAAACDTQERKKAFLDWIRIITSSLKCLNCREHATEYVNSHPPEEFMNIPGEKGLFKWTWLFHNTVNRRLGKPELDFDTAYQMYLPQNGVCVKDCGEETPKKIEEPIGVTAIPSYSVLSKNNTGRQAQGITYVPTYRR